MISRRGKHYEDVRHRVSFVVVPLHRRRHGFTAGVAEILEQCDAGLCENIRQPMPRQVATSSAPLSLVWQQGK
jgi:hypothetical protein